MEKMKEIIKVNIVELVYIGTASEYIKMLSKLN